jgi:hypothetical protein
MRDSFFFRGARRVMIRQRRAGHLCVAEGHDPFKVIVD